MKLSDFDYSYPKDLIAQRPLRERDSSRMMIVDRRAKSWQHAHTALLPDTLRKGDVLVVNDSRVIPARLFGTRATGEAIELLVVEPAREGKTLWRCLLKRAKRIRTGEKFFFGMQATATARGREDIYLLVEFKDASLELAMRYHGVPPLPPYIEREGFEAYSKEDRERYQTVFADKPGSAAAPTAGLHLSEALLESTRQRGIDIVNITLHVGIDTFAPVRAEKLSEHRMHGERIEISEKTAHRLLEAKKNGERIIAVGTTAARALESAAAFEVTGSDGFEAWQGGRIHHGRWSTELFITPGYDFRLIDALLTNFHQPKSTLLMMVAAFAGREFILNCYQEAIREQYRLFSYGDCMFIQ